MFQNLPEVESESNGFMSLVGGLPRQHNVESLALLLLITCIQVYNEKEQQVRKKF